MITSTNKGYIMITFAIVYLLFTILSLTVLVHKVNTAPLDINMEYTR